MSSACSSPPGTNEADAAVQVDATDAGATEHVEADAGPSNAPTFAPGELDAPSNGGTLTFQLIGKAGTYPSRRDPASGQCDAIHTAACCMATHALSDDQLSPWNEELIFTLRGPMRVKQLAAYQPIGARWERVSLWDERAPRASTGVGFNGNRTETAGFAGTIGSECLVDVSTATPFPCGPGSSPYCTGTHRFWGWSGAKLFVLLASMPHIGAPQLAGSACGQGTTGNWYDAPWIGLSHGELIRAGAFGGCHCYAQDPAKWFLGDGCGQLNAFEVVNDNNSFRNLDVFSTNFFGYAGYVGQGPCGSRCNVSTLDPAVDLIDKSTSREASAGAVATPASTPGVAFRRPSSGARYFVMLFDPSSRTVQLAVIHPQRVPDSMAALLPALPFSVDQLTVDQLRELRLPR
ncbi:MAG: DUF2403 domain-containing protein [Archangium sp.]|nr:DUF2403 domain-containing protein [Archangium sp.]